ncbi:MAG: AMP-binding protein, partial [Caldimonas sp.]
MASPSEYVVPADRPHLAVWPKRLPLTLAIPQTSLWLNLEVSAQRFPDKPAYLFFGRPLTYRAMREQAEAIAGWLQHRGVGAGDRVVVFMQNCPQFAVALYAALRANAVVVPVNPMNRAEELKHYITDPQTSVVVCSADLAAIVEQAQTELPEDERARHVLVTRFADTMPADGEIAPADAPPPAMLDWLHRDPPLPAGYVRWNDALAEQRVPGPHTAAADDLALLPYTSGTTGMPKGCMHTHRTLMSNTVGGQWSYGSAEAVALGVVPMFHITGMLYSVFGSVYSGSTIVLMPRWDRELAGRLISHHRISHWVCIPTMVIDLFGSPNYRSFDLSSLRSISGGGAAMPHAVAERLRDEFGLTFAEGYGLTETAAPSHANPPERAKLQCLGIPIFG